MAFRAVNRYWSVMARIDLVTFFAGLLFCQTAIPCQATVYYVDAESGNDSHVGTSAKKAWKTLDRVNSATFQPGDEIRFKAGTRYTGELKPQGSGDRHGSTVRPIVIRSYGRGARPRIDGEGKTIDTLLLRNVEYWEVQDLEITNLGDKRQPSQTGVHIIADAFGPAHHIRLRNLFVHDVNGDLRKEREGCGIFFESRGGNDTHFDDLRIEDCRVVHTDRNGICQRTGSRARSTGVIIRSNLLEDIGGDGIKIWGSNGALVEWNVVHGARMRCEDYAAGIWPFDSDDTIIQFNEVSGMHGTKDGQGFDADYRCRGSLFQYNYSHDNDGGFMLICAPGNSYNEDAVIRYNISQNDGLDSASVFHFGGASRNALVYNNTIYVGPKRNLRLLLFDEWDGGHADGTRFFNNLFYVDGAVSYSWGASTNTVFDQNVFFGRHTEVPQPSRNFTTCPPLRAAGTGGFGIASLAGYRLSRRPVFPRGWTIPQNGGRDFFGRRVANDAPPSIGASEQSR